MTRVVICSPLEPELVARIAAVDPRVEVLYEPELLPVPRYAGDHVGVLPELTDEQRRRWFALTSTAEVAFDFDRRAPAEVNENFPLLRWVQATSAGLGRLTDRFPLDLSEVAVTTAAGVHAVPLAEFVLTGLLHFVKDVPQLKAWQAEHRWNRYTSRTLSGQRVLVVGLGAVGRHTAAVLAGLGVEVVGAVRPGGTSGAPGVAEVVGFDELTSVLPRVDAVVLACPLTPQTEGLLGAAELAALKPHAVVVNIARGQVVDEAAMTAALASGALRGAVLDVASVEPLPDDSPLWDLPNVIVSPHSASTATDENALITDIFCDNLRRWLDGRPLRNRYRPELGY
ncbi:phosphoglycerate dehydrogenase-like enzyme [Saccharothrix tamanrassetensis]|uniref:Phosphoglycerate dehydrogenase-like enzyme n=1 Tax=Saccharothrix tamanrassetensis TaxID=1051531 RepID=A0A841CLF7_9PSEU|nr:D-2-hydroxyacid dehydrogenase [Saccharothrix tamanrassetensis]MBB5957204.1 phosphoglycerate dehydrogenase-like enzyme [Saccharothrix tamanrassetensis]